MPKLRDTHLDKVCDVCGDFGFQEALSACSKCAVKRHRYCMPVLVGDSVEDWICEECLSEGSCIAPPPSASFATQHATAYSQAAVSQMVIQASGLVGAQTLSYAEAQIRDLQNENKALREASSLAVARAERAEEKLARTEMELIAQKAACEMMERDLKSLVAVLADESDEKLAKKTEDLVATEAACEIMEKELESLAEKLAEAEERMAEREEDLVAKEAAWKTKERKLEAQIDSLSNTVKELIKRVQPFRRRMNCKLTT